MGAQHTNRYRKKYQDTIREMRKKKFSKDEEMELAFTMHEIESYGFNFFPDFYVEALVDHMKEFVRERGR